MNTYSHPRKNPFIYLFPNFKFQKNLQPKGISSAQFHRTKLLFFIFLIENLLC